MKLESIKDISKLIDLCRKKGVDSIEVDGVKLSLSDVPHRTKSKSKAKQEESPEAPTEALYEPTSEELLMWSVGNIPSEQSNENN